jgi:hypothetical protein
MGRTTERADRKMESEEGKRERRIARAQGWERGRRPDFCTKVLAGVKRSSRRRIKRA